MLFTSWFFRDILYNLSFYEIICYFLIYAFLGWVMEVAYATIKTHKFINRGFLNGPVCPIYGAGAVLVIICLYPVRNHAFLVFLLSMLITTAIEFLTGWVLELMYHKKWWDYSGRKFNIKGYICLEFSVIWGIACLFVYDILHKGISYPVEHLNHTVGFIILIIFLTIFITDVIASTVQATKFAKYITKAQVISEKLKESSNAIGEKISSATLELTDKYNEMVLKLKGSSKRLLKAFPTMKDKRNANLIEDIKTKWRELYHKNNKKKEE